MSKKERDFVSVKILLDAKTLHGALSNYFANSLDWLEVEEKIADDVKIADVYKYTKSNVKIIIPSESDICWREHTVEIMDCIVLLIFQKKLPPEIQSDIMSEIRKQTVLLG